MIDKKEKPIVLFPVNINPPNIGHLSAINTLLDVAQKIIIVVYDNPQVLSTDASIGVLNDIISKYKDSSKITVIKSKLNFSTLNEIPNELIMPEKAFMIATTSRHIYANLKEKGYPYLFFIRRMIGWRDEFYKIAFVRSIKLHNIENMKIW